MIGIGSWDRGLSTRIGNWILELRIGDWGLRLGIEIIDYGSGIRL